MKHTLTFCAGVTNILSLTDWYTDVCLIILRMSIAANVRARYVLFVKENVKTEIRHNDKRLVSKASTFAFDHSKIIYLMHS